MLKRLVCLCMVLCACPAVAGTVIDVDFARGVFLGLGPERNCESYDRYMAVLAGLSKDELRRLREIVAQDLNAQDHAVVGPDALDRRMAHGLLNEIDDRLGTLDYDLVLDGRFLGCPDAGAGVTYCSFRTSGGEIVAVYVGVSTVMPSYEYTENCEDHVRIFVKKSMDPNNPAGYVAKIEPLQLSPPAAP